MVNTIAPHLFCALHPSSTRFRTTWSCMTRPGRRRLSCRAVRTAHNATGFSYVVPDEKKHLFQTQGFVHLESVLNKRELDDVVIPFYTRFMNREVDVKGKDYCDMSGAIGRSPEEYTLHNAMLPRMYLPEIQGNEFELRCKEIVRQLCEEEMGIDYDQILAKKPESTDSVFAWHQDLAYWPITAAPTTSATCWLAVDDSTRENGCMRFIPGSHLEAQLRPHKPVDPTRTESHVLAATVNDDDRMVYAEIKRGDITVLNERVIHGSGPNTSKGWRRAYVLAFRTKACIKEERAMGFTHSHNDIKSWDVFHQHH